MRNVDRKSFFLAVFFIMFFCSSAQAQEEEKKENVQIECLAMDILVEKYFDLDHSNEYLFAKLDDLEKLSKKVLFDSEGTDLPQALLDKFHSWRQISIDHAAELLEENKLYFERDSFQEDESVSQEVSPYKEECALSADLEKVQRNQAQVVKIIDSVELLVAGLKKEIFRKDLDDILIIAEMERLGLLN